MTVIKEKIFRIVIALLDEIGLRICALNNAIPENYFVAALKMSKDSAKTSKLLINR